MKIYIAVWHMNEFDYSLDDYVWTRHESKPYSNREAAQAHCDWLNKEYFIDAEVQEVYVKETFDK